MVKWSSGWSLTWACSTLPTPCCIRTISTPPPKSWYKQGNTRPRSVLVTILSCCWMITCTTHKHLGYKTKFRAKADSNWRIFHHVIPALFHCNIKISGLLWWCSRKKMEPSWWIGWSHHYASKSHSQKKVRGCEGRGQQSFYSLNEWLFFARMLSFWFIFSLEVIDTCHLLFCPVTYVSLSTVSPSSPLLYNYSLVGMAKV